MVLMSSAFRRLLGAAVALSSVASATVKVRSLDERASTGDRLVMAHFMIGIVSDRTSSSDYDDDMQRALAVGIDAFALNIGTDYFTDTQLGFAYDSASRNGMKVFISFDFNWWNTSDAQGVGQKVQQYASQPAQLLVNGRPFASSFAGDGLDVNAMKAAAGVDVYFVPNFHPGQSTSDEIDGGFNWMAWPNNGNNKAPTPGANVTVADGDNSYLAWLNGKPYMAPLSGWFSTHYGPEVSYSKNFVFPGGSLIFDRWNYILQQGFPMVEMITYNDYGESHYLGPLKSLHYDDGNSKWANDMPHDAWLDLSKPFIAAYKNNDTDVAKYVTSDLIVYWYRRNLKDLDCDATDTTANTPANNASGNYFEGKPNGWQDMDDDVYVATMLTQPGTVTVTSGNTTVVQDVPAGAYLFTVPANLGQQSFVLSRNSTTVLSDTSLMNITSVCPCGIYNFNAYVGSVPPTFPDPLGPDGLSSLTVGLHVTTCKATPTLGIDAAFTMTTMGSPASTSATPTASPTPKCGQVCVAGTVAPGQSGNYIGLCSFSCNFGYCPPGPCVCTAYGTKIPAPPTNGLNGCPIAGEDDSYSGLCSFTCNHGYCPDGACQYC